MNELKKHLSKIVLGLSIIVVIIDLYVVLHFFSIPKFGRMLVGGNLNAFILYLKYEVLGLVIFAIILAVANYFINGTLIEAVDNEDKYSELGSTITRYAGGLAVIFLVVALLSKVIVGY